MRSDELIRMANNLNGYTGSEREEGGRKRQNRKRKRIKLMLHDKT